MGLWQKLLGKQPEPDSAEMLTDRAVAYLAAAAPTAEVIRGDRGGISVVEPIPVSMWGASSIAGEVDKAANPPDSIGDYWTYQWYIRGINQFRLKAMDFESLYFTQPKKLCCTDAKAVVVRPARCPDEDTYEAMSRRILPPFEHFNKRVNYHLVGKRGGVSELSSWVLDHCFEGGVAAWSAAVNWVKLNGYWWRTITEVNVYSGAQLGLDLKNTQFANERWYIRDMPQMQRTQYDNGFPMGYDSTSYEDSHGNVSPGWQKVEHSPDKGIYRGVIKYLHAEGQRSKYPVPPYAPLVDILTCRWLMTKKNLSTLSRESALWLWRFDAEKMAAHGVQWDDVASKNADGTTTVKPGAVSVFMQNRAAVVQGTAKAQEIALPDYVTLSIESPNMAIIEATDTWTQFSDEVLRNGGFFVDERGRLAKEPSEQFTTTNYLYNRKQTIEPFLSQLYGIIFAENERLFHARNGFQIGDPVVDPFHFVSDVGRRILKAKRAPTPEGRYKQKIAQINAALNGDMEDVQVKPSLIPSQALRADNMDSWLLASRQGDISHATLHEALGLDPDEERARLALEKRRDVYRKDDTLVSIYSPDLISQTSSSTKVAPGGDAEVVRRTDLNEPSPGRPKGTPDGS